jgi:hypothetical protein
VEEGEAECDGEKEAPFEDAWGEVEVKRVRMSAVERDIVM